MKNLKGFESKIERVDLIQISRGYEKNNPIKKDLTLMFWLTITLISALISLSFLI